MSEIPDVMTANVADVAQVIEERKQLREALWMICVSETDAAREMAIRYARELLLKIAK